MVGEYTANNGYLFTATASIHHHRHLDAIEERGTMISRGSSEWLTF